MAEDIRHLAQRLKGLREVLEIPIEQMAQVCETSVEHYLKMESGEADPGVYRLSRVAKKFGISLDVLLFGEEPRMVGYFVTRKGQSTQVGLSSSRIRSRTPAKRRSCGILRTPSSPIIRTQRFSLSFWMRIRRM